MVSPFMSIATGALQAVDKNIDRYRAEQAAEAERADAAAQRMKELNFQRQTKLDVQELAGEQAKDAARIRFNGERLKNFKVYGEGENAIEVRRAATPDKQSLNLLLALEANPDKFDALMNDAVHGPLLRADLRGAYGAVRRTSGVFSNDRFGEAYGGEKPLNNVAGYLRSFLGIKNKQLLEQARIFGEKRPDDAGSAPVNTDLTVMKGGQIKDITGSNIEGFDAAAEVYRRNNLGFKNRPLQFAKRQLLSKLTDNNITDTTSLNRIVKAAANPGLMAVISGTILPSQAQKDEALKFITNPENGFIDGSGKLNINDFSQFVNIFGRKMAGTALEASDPMPQLFQGNETALQKKELESALASGNMARVALKTSAEIRKQIELSGAGGSIIQRATALTGEVPAFVASAGNLVRSIMRDRGQGANFIIDAAGNRVQALNQKAQDLFTNTAAKAMKAEANFQNNQSEANQEALAAAKLEMLELTFAYQLTGILQGGTGGRTISDQDITRAMAMFRSSMGTVTSRLQKLDFIDKLLTGAVNKEVLFSILQRGDTNRDMFVSVSNASKLFETGANLDNLQNQVNRYATEKVGELPSRVRTNNAQEIIKSAVQIPAVADSPNYQKGKYIDGVNMVLTQGDKIAPGMIVGNRYVINANAYELTRRMLQQFPNQRTPEMAKGRETVQKRVNSMVDSVFDLVTGQVVPAQLRTEVQTKGKNKGKEFPSIFINEVSDPASPAAAPTAATVPQAAERLFRPALGRSLESRRVRPRPSTEEEIAAAEKERREEAQMNAKRLEQSRLRALRGGSGIFSGRQ